MKGRNMKVINMRTGRTSKYKPAKRYRRKRAKAIRSFPSTITHMQHILVNRETLAALAMHGILAACASPQFYDRILGASAEEKTSPHRFIAHMAYQLVNAMQLEGHG
jgi:hypothetical protein